MSLTYNTLNKEASLDSSRWFVVPLSWPIHHGWLSVFSSFMCVTTETTPHKRLPTCLFAWQRRRYRVRESGPGFYGVDMTLLSFVELSKRVWDHGRLECGFLRAFWSGDPCFELLGFVTKALMLSVFRVGIRNHSFGSDRCFSCTLPNGDYGVYVINIISTCWNRSCVQNGRLAWYS